MYDLHLHSQRSDGQLEPLTLAEHLIGLGFQGFSITDHNYLSADLAAVKNFAESYNVSFIAGIEISSRDYDTGLSWHVLGYGDELNARQINQELAVVRTGYNRRAQMIIEKLNRAYSGLKLNFEQLLERSGSSYLDRNRIALELRNYLNDGRTVKELLPEVFTKEADDWMLHTKEVVELIVTCGGRPVLAHPGRQADRNLTDFESFIEQLVSAGLAGLESRYAKHNPEQVTYLNRIAERHELLVTGGSDWHGPTYSAGTTPGCELTADEFAKFLAVIKKPRNSEAENY